MQTIGFIGLGVMGEPMCRHLLQKLEPASHQIFIADLAAEPLQRLQVQGAQVMSSAREVFDRAQIVFLSLPGGPQVQSVVAESGWLSGQHSGAVLVDLGTTPVDQTRAMAQQLADCGVAFMDAPVARTRQAAEQGNLAIMAGASDEVFAQIQPLLQTFASDVVHCGGHGCGQVVKILNNMVLFQTVLGLAEAVTIGGAAGVPAERLLDALSNGSADSFALRNHGLKALLPDHYPQQAFSTRYADKDLSYALQLAASNGVELRGAELVRDIFAQAIADGHGDNYWPVIKKVVERQAT